MNGLSTEFFFYIADWEWDGETTQIRRDDLTVEDYYSPSHYIEVLNDRIVKHDAYSLYYERAQVQLLMDAPDLAYQDIQSSVRKYKEQISGSVSPNLQEVLRVKAIIQSELNQYEQALETIDRVLTLGREQDDNLERDFFLRWILQNEAGQAVFADQALETACGVGAELIFERVIQSPLNDRRQSDSCRPLYSYVYKGYWLYRDGQYSQAQRRLQTDLDFYSRPRFNHETLLANLVLARIGSLPETVSPESPKLSLGASFWYAGRAR